MKQVTLLPNDCNQCMLTCSVVHINWRDTLTLLGFALGLYCLHLPHRLRKPYSSSFSKKTCWINLLPLCSSMPLLHFFTYDSPGFPFLLVENSMHGFWANPVLAFPLTPLRYSLHHLSSKLQIKLANIPALMGHTRKVSSQRESFR